ncbi:hypothetical protein N7493_007446 [Penicillium malachiteum]|uniref:Mediator of RNA polymerase II transcription subunit 11 n=1 Tax=Penicillium malachiteum TaxID=1324776 RepID=A0AAD6MU43_9EURO|nr:hypothetical protein N7493_007446 [Penicillium malachiteum]
MENPNTTITFSSADRIRQLNDIDQDVAKLINSAGLAIQALSNASPDSSSTHDGSLQAHKTQFKEATAQYFALLSSIDVRLRRQVYALEEASVLGPDSNSRTGETTGAGTTGTGGPGSGGAANPLDISWLNSRKDTVGKDKESELWASARQFVEQLETDKPNGDPEDMQVD